MNDAFKCAILRYVVCSPCGLFRVLTSVLEASGRSVVVVIATANAALLVGGRVVIECYMCGCCCCC